MTEAQHSWKAVRFRLSRVSVFVLVSMTVLVAAGPAKSSAKSLAARNTRAGARLIYLRDCASCHGPAAHGTSYGPSLQQVGAASVDYWLSTGRMPLIRGTRPAASGYGELPPSQRLSDPHAVPRRATPAYSPDVISGLVHYVGSLAPGGPEVPRVALGGADLASGGELFRAQCAACHEWAGVGGALYQREAPALHRSTPTQIAEAVRIGPGQMPAFGTAAVPVDQMAALVAYVRYLDHPQNRGGNPLWYLGPVAEGGLIILGGLGTLLLICRWIGERS